MTLEENKCICINIILCWTQYGWEFSQNLTHNWETLMTGVTNYIKSLNWIHRVSLRNAKIDYYNMEGSFVDEHTLKMRSGSGEEKTITSKWFLLSVGGRPTLPEDVPGAKEHAITSDDIFYLQVPSSTDDTALDVPDVLLNLIV